MKGKTDREIAAFLAAVIRGAVALLHASREVEALRAYPRPKYGQLANLRGADLSGADLSPRAHRLARRTSAARTRRKVTNW